MLPAYCTDIAEYREWIKGPPAIYDYRDQPRYESKIANIQDAGQDEINEWIADLDAKEFSAPSDTLQERFLQLAGEWQKAVSNSSSLTAIASHPKYRQIINLGKDAVPFLLIDLERNNRFWFPALHEITGIQPFDRSDYGNPKRMTKAWIQWGKRKGII